MHGYKSSAEYAVFDMCRCNDGQYWPFQFMECLSNGWFFSTKYMGGTKIFKRPKIVVFCNQKPDMTKLSMDRYEIYNI